jgi:hypothetical protein
VVAIVENKRDQIVGACATHHVARLFVFGSVLREDFVPGSSDIDFLVEFEPLDPFTLTDTYFSLLDELRTILDTTVDLVMSDAVKNRYIRAEIERTKQVLYAA